MSLYMEPIALITFSAAVPKAAVCATRASELARVTASTILSSGAPVKNKSDTL